MVLSDLSIPGGSILPIPSAEVLLNKPVEELPRYKRGLLYEMPGPYAEWANIYLHCFHSLWDKRLEEDAAREQELPEKVFSAFLNL